MKNLNLILPAILIAMILSTSCSKEEVTPAPTQTPTNNNSNLVFEDNLIGVWNLASHEYNANGGNYVNTGNTGSMSFLSNGTYTHSDFTYAWHCNPGANVSDSGIWSYDAGNNKLTLTSTKPQGGNAYATVVADILSFNANEIVFSFDGNDCPYQNVRITLIR